MFKSILSLSSRLLEITQKMAMLQEEPVIVKPRPGRPNTQNPPWRGRENFQRATVYFFMQNVYALPFISVCNSYDDLEVIPRT